MPLIINGTEIEDLFIKQEIARLRPEYIKVFKEQAPEEQEKQLYEWAKENVIEQYLMQQEAIKSSIKIDVKELKNKYNEVITNIPENIKFSPEDELNIKNNIEIQSQITKIIDALIKNKNPKNDDERDKIVENYIDSLKEKAEIIEFQPDMSNKKAPDSTTKTTDSQLKKIINSILIKPAGPDCNMACTYCFYLDKAKLFNTTKTHRMSEKILEETIKQTLNQGGPNISFGWQGGEPTLMGLPFFEKAIELQQKYGKRQSIGNGLQTNGILINKEWANFLKKYNFLVGLSLDGPEHIHNHYRPLQSGKGSWQQVIDSAKLMLDTEVAVNALSVVNDYSAQFPEEIYNFHKDIGLTFMQFIPCIENDPQDNFKIAPFSVSAKQYGNFLCKTFDLWMADFKDGQPTTSIRYFDSVFYSYVDMQAPECTLHSACGIYVVIEHNGDVYSCDFFVEPKWKLGNITNDNMTDLLNSDQQTEFGLLKANLNQACKDCKWLNHCQGGCIKDRIVTDNNANNLSHFCESYKMFFEHADKKMQQLAIKWQQEQMLNSPRYSFIKSIKNGELKIDRNDLCPCGSGLKFKKCCVEYI